MPQERAGPRQRIALHLFALQIRVVVAAQLCWGMVDVPRNIVLTLRRLSFADGIGLQRDHRPKAGTGERHRGAVEPIEHVLGGGGPKQRNAGILELQAARRGHTIARCGGN